MIRQPQRSTQSRSSAASDVYKSQVKRESIAVILFAIVAIIASIVALLDVVNIMRCIWIKMVVIAFVTIPLGVVYNDYRINVIKENQLEG